MSTDGLTPFVLPTQLANGQRNGLGVILLVVQPNANTDTTIAHPLRRVPTLVMALDNGVNFVPRTKRSATAWTPRNVTIQFDAPCPAPGVFVWVL